MEFQVPATDIQLSNQVYAHVSDHTEDVDMSEFLVSIPKKYRFAGYIGCIDFLFEEVTRLKTELEKIKKQKRSWFF